MNDRADDSLKERVFKPLGMQHALSRLEDNLRFRVTVGHVPDATNPKKLIVPERPFLSVGGKAAGATPAMTAEDLLRFAAVHMHGGTGMNGAKLLSRRSAAEMLRPQLISGRRSPPRGLAWELSNWNGQRIFTHSGGTVGQFSLLIVIPGKRLAVAALTNGGNAGGVFDDVVGGLLKSLAGCQMPGLPEPQEGIRVKPAELIGAFENINLRVEVSEDEGQLMGWGGSKENADPRRPAKLDFVNSRMARFPSAVLEWDGPRGEKAASVRLYSRLLVRVA